MGEKNIVNIGVDTLVLNVFYANEQGKPYKRDLDAACGNPHGAGNQGSEHRAVLPRGGQPNQS